jgi:maleate isomerase
MTSTDAKAEEYEVARPFIDYGDRLRIGMLLPSGNVIAEPQIKAMVPLGVAVYTTRLPLTGSSTAELLAMIENLEAAARLVADACVDLVAFNCTAVSTFSKDLEGEIEARIQRATGLPVVLTSKALVAAARAQRARRLVLLTPYIPEVNEREVAFLEQAGLQILSQTGLGINSTSEMASLEPERWLELARQRRHPQAEAYLISCTAVRSAEMIGILERELGRPVITSNQALVWECLRSAGIDDGVEGFGSLLALTRRASSPPHLASTGPAMARQAPLTSTEGAAGTPAAIFGSALCEP